ncbi:hypothetical protein [Neobacillus cucumis]|uniref:Uncharacterized protein n=1 Tax=Neobacillus cucumis TaxID=1740721 RepID=A0A2N5HEW7_9BACI|nr:hypothetical protein [Neobacillus cucumis]PLS04045.1 hypothetical protein CVD27_12870 [Neobacillus cucumis]
MKQNKFVDPKVTREEMVKVLVKGLGRSLTDIEAKKLFWLSETFYETRGVILDIFKELVERQED